ncbi:MAG: transporter substrate-binding domain-containing protein [Flavobacteriaceae bacterium]|nr:transporter substrate-binding domain-containing protein [Flavobacteriaceae bacterium]
MKHVIRLLILFILLGWSCEAPIPKEDESQLLVNAVKRDLEEIKKDGKLKALLVYSSTSYFLYRGRPMGYEYELLQRLADHLELELEIILSKDLDMLLHDLTQGEVDIMAHGIAITSARKKIIAYTKPLYVTNQVLVQRKPDNWRRMTLDNIKKQLAQDPLDLIGDTVSVRKNSNYYDRLINLNKEIGGDIIINTLDGTISTDAIIKMVADGKIKYTFANKNLASINASYFPMLDISVPVSSSQRIAWAVRTNSPNLLEATDNWLKKQRRHKDFNVIYNKYFKNKRNYKRRVKSDFYSLNSNQISKYDDLIKSYSDSVGWDWRLVASLVYQESRFEPQASSWAGAAGLMQMMPATAKELGVTNRLDPKDNIRGGTKYLKELYENFSEITDSIQRIKFTMASYNCGYYHVKDAQKLAEFYNLDKNVWDRNVEDMILALRYPKDYNRDFIKYGYVNGYEPFKYVIEIFARYDHYIQFIHE